MSNTNNIDNVVNMFIVGRTFKISELFDPIIWESKTITEQLQISDEFKNDVTSKYKDIIIIDTDNESSLKVVYKKVRNLLKKEKENVFPDQPINIKRNERGNA